MTTQDADARKRQIEREARMGRKPSLAEQIGHNAAGCLKGESPVAPLEQVINELGLFVREQVRDPSGALISVLQRRIRTNEPLVDRHLHAPFTALRALVEDIVSHEEKLVELVRETDMRWGQLMDERPHFEVPGRPPHREDEYTRGTVRAALNALLAAIERAQR